ncbi:hypothetical protein DPMN_050281 [Dreissena polymorpha]|uniref:Uncharacterized protein n=1 Tax=Dreissena polymorpha TaxID=45954 RepID=A0A9D4HM50_DREPO|nr:hypothetical protein DPMN_050281 [Dreissena polymorpha]
MQYIKALNKNASFSFHYLLQVPCDWLHMDRIYGDCQLHSATGRVSLSEPNLQNVPKDFDIQLPGRQDI